jgi:N-acetylmuramoyl-L-alanine amidase
MKQLLNQTFLPWIRQRFRRQPLWIAIMVCACCGIILGSTLSRTVPQQATVSNAMASSAEPSGLLHQSPLMAIDTDSDDPSRGSKPLLPTKKTVALTGTKNNIKLAQQKGFNQFDCSPSPRTRRNVNALKALQNLPLTRFRSTANQTQAPLREDIQIANFTNFGWRFLTDWSGNSALYQPIVVLHETVGSDESVLNLFQVEHKDEDDQVSYHVVIREDGLIIYVVPPEYRAYGAGNSVFVNADRVEESVKTHGSYPPSVNNFAYHISLVTPEDGRNDEPTHSGYTKNQYEALAWLVAKTGVAEDRITTHQLIDRSGTRMDPRSFNVPYFLQRLNRYPRTQEINIGCTLADATSRPKTAN